MSTSDDQMHSGDPSLDPNFDINDVFSLRKPKDFKAGLSSGLKSCAKGIFGGIVGLVAAPVVGATQEGFGGFAKGLLHGVVGVVVLPVAGLAIGTTQMVRGAINQPECFREEAQGNIWDEEKREWVDGKALATLDAPQPKPKKGTRGPGFRGPGASSVPEIDYYEVLQVSKDASTDQIRKQYYVLARKYHPDKNPGDEGAHKKFQQLGQAYQVLGTPELRAKYDNHGSSGLDVNFMDGGEFFNALFGDDAFEHLVGELVLATAARSGGELSQSEIKRMQAVRIDQLVVNLKDLLRQHEIGDVEGFKSKQTKSAEQLVKAPFGEVLLHAIGKVYDMQADIFLGGFIDGTLAKFRQQGETIRSQLNAANAAIKVFQAQQRIEAWQKDKERREGAGASAAGANPNASGSSDAEKGPNGENKSYDELLERAKLEADALPLMLDAMWAANVLDIQDTLKSVCKKAMSGLNDKEQKKRAEALKELGTIFLLAAPLNPNMTNKDAKSRMEEAMTRAMHKATNEKDAEAATAAAASAHGNGAGPSKSADEHATDGAGPSTNGEGPSTA